MTSLRLVRIMEGDETVASRAAAMARAQQELRSPEKSLIGQIPATSPREQARSFRYASLASGLEIIRKSLGRQEIAAIQATAIDKDIGLVRLTTVLAIQENGFPRNGLSVRLLMRPIRSEWVLH
jgi:hypothetical protein